MSESNYRYSKQVAWLLGVLVAGGLNPVMAAEQATDSPQSKWQASAELGLIMNRGNTDTDSLNTRLSVENTRNKWRHKAEARAYG